MGKARSNKNNKQYKLETLCLECGARGINYVSEPSKGCYNFLEKECYTCLKKTNQIECKNLDELKAKLEFSPNRSEQDDMILNIMNDNKVKTL
jgi:hypothetical protein